MTEVLRGITFPLASAPEVPSVELFNVSDRASLAVATYDSLGFLTDRDEAFEDYQQKLESLHQSLVLGHKEGDPIVEPFIGLELPSDFAFNSLVAAFDKNQSFKTVTYDTLWNQYGAAELNSRLPGKLAKPDTHDLTGEVQGQAMAMLLGGDITYEGGLYFTGKNLKGQLKAFKDRKASYDSANSGSELLVANPADYVIISAMRREAGEPLPDVYTYSRFIQFVMLSADGASYLPRALFRDDRLKLRGSRGRAHGGVGVRLLVGQKPDTLAA